MLVFANKFALRSSVTLTFDFSVPKLCHSYTCRGDISTEFNSSTTFRSLLTNPRRGQTETGRLVQSRNAGCTILFAPELHKWRNSSNPNNLVCHGVQYTSAENCSYTLYIDLHVVGSDATRVWHATPLHTRVIIRAVEVCVVRPVFVTVSSNATTAKLRIDISMKLTILYRDREKGLQPNFTQIFPIVGPRTDSRSCDQRSRSRKTFSEKAKACTAASRRFCLVNVWYFAKKRNYKNSFILNV